MATFGENLKRERELREISLRQISEATKINIRYLEALEANRFEALPGGLFNKGFIRAYAKYVGIDGEALVTSYLHELSSGSHAPEPSGRGAANLHRPAEAPQRRTQAAGSAGRGAVPAAAQAPPALPRRREAPPAEPSAPVERATPAAHAAPIPPAVPAAPAAHAPAPAASRRSANASRESEARHPGVPAATDIEESDPGAPGSSRVIVWVLSLVAAAGIVFLVASLMRGTPPAPSQPSQNPAGQDGSLNGAQSQSTEPSTMTLGALGAPAPQPAPSPAAAPALAAASGSPATATPAASVPAAERRADRPRPTPPPAPVPAPPAADSAPARSAPDAMDVDIEAGGRTFVVLSCDGKEVANRMMDEGEHERARCGSVVRISASDAGATRLTVNGAACLPLGDPGTRAYGYTIRIDDLDRICPAREGGRHGRR